MTDYRTEAPPILREFLTYHETIQGHSKKTVDEYFLDLRTFFRYIKIEKNRVPRSAPLEEISISDVDLALIKSVTLADIYAYLSFLSRDRVKNAKNPGAGFGLAASSRARKVATIRSFYKYLVTKAKLLEESPIQELDSPRMRQALPRYLTLDESIQLLESIDGDNAERDFCIITLFLNCGVRISELVGLNLTDIRGDRMRVLGKGNKERVVYLNAACQNAIEDWLEVRSRSGAVDPYALFITRKHTRITKAGVHYMLKQRFTAAGLDSSKYSAHKLRHTAATLMLQNGVDVRTLQEVLGHEHLNTTQIYTHVDSDALQNAAQSNPLSQIKAKPRRGRPKKAPQNEG
ncbi:MAG: tyrosine recombinase XerC [Oscillospiraceae bacterium]|nr:tyrosine recombinase XerC [Oscillospiraceae bacterium]